MTAAARLLALAVVLAVRSAALGADEPPVAEQADGAGLGGPLGRVEYEAGRGLRIGGTGLTIGGFATAEAERLEDGETSGAFEGVNFLLSFDPVPYLHVFSELEIGQLLEAKDDKHGLRSDPGVTVERLYLDAGASDAANARFGKFQTPIGRWNPVLAEPLTWTASEPLIVEEVFDEHATGAMLRGSLFPRGGAFSYSLYGTFLDPIAPDRGAPPAEHSAGAYLEWASLAGWSIGASYFASEGEDDSWNHLGGGDFLWTPIVGVELSGEALVGEGTREEGSLWGLYAQAAVETLPTIWLVGRYERFDPPELSRAVDLFDVGLAWIPVPYLRLKADYRFADHFDDEFGAAGFRSSLSVLF